LHEKAVHSIDTTHTESPYDYNTPPIAWGYTKIPVFHSYTIIQPAAMMVELLHTAIAVPTMFGPHWPHSFTSVTDVVNWVVDIIEITPW